MLSVNIKLKISSHFFLQLLFNLLFVLLGVLDLKTSEIVLDQLFGVGLVESLEYSRLDRILD
jgi:hypothetical protein